MCSSKCSIISSSCPACELWEGGLGWSGRRVMADGAPVFFSDLCCVRMQSLLQIRTNKPHHNSAAMFLLMLCYRVCDLSTRSFTFIPYEGCGFCIDSRCICVYRASVTAVQQDNALPCNPNARCTRSSCRAHADQARTSGSFC